MKKLIILFSLIFPLAIFGQAYLKRADKHYKNYNYPKVINKLEDRKSLPTNANRELAESYKMTGEYDKAEATYAKVIAASDKTPQDVYAYAQILKINKKYTEAQAQMSAYAALSPNDSRSILFNKNTNYTNELLKDKGQFEVKNLLLNTEEQEFGAVYYKEQIVYATTYHKIGPTYYSWNANKLHFLDLYVGKANANGEVLDPKRMKKLDKKYHDGSASFTKDGNTLFYTRDNYKKRSSTGIRNLEIWESEFKDGKWHNKSSFTLNNKEYSVGQPAISADGKTLYFSSDMPGGKGGADLYKITRDTNGVWGKAENLGDKINTEGNEVFPFIHEDGILFFASDGRLGLGGLDIFAVQVTKNQYSKVLNIGTPANTNKDDFSFVLNTEKTKGYLASNRDGGKGNDDIYGFNLLKPFVFGKTIKGTTKDTDGNTVAGAEVTLMDSNGVALKTIITKEDGAYSFDVDENKTFKLKATKDKYFDALATVKTNVDPDVIIADLALEKNPGIIIIALVTDKKTSEPLSGVKLTLTDLMTGKTESFVTGDNGQYMKELPEKHLNDFLNYDIYLEREGYLRKHANYSKKITKPGVYNIHEVLDLNMSKVEVGLDIAKAINLNPIYFDLGKYNIRPDAALELEKIIQIMNEYPNMVVELGSHSDCRGNKNDNMKLSDKRAKASATYIKKQIKFPERIFGRGYGESKLVNGCACEGKVVSNCTEEEHQQNRRTEFIIIKMK